MNRAIAEINLSALQNNFQIVKKIAPQTKILAMIKANGYGHGAIRVAQTLQHADAFGVACLEEAFALRDAQIKKPIVLMMGITSASELKDVAKHQIDIVLHQDFQVEMLTKTAMKNPINAWLKIDTGMHRLGFAPEKVPQIYQKLLQTPHINKPIILMTHFAESDNPNADTTKKQLAKFATITQNLAGDKSLANSAGIIAWPKSHADWVRPGIMLYGVSPLATKKFNEIGLEPVMTLKSKLIAINLLRKGDAVGYGGTWTCPEDMPVGVVAIGYGAGYPRYAKSGTPVLIRNARCPLIGRVSMDMITVDLRGCPDANINDSAILWGSNLPAEEIAICSDTIPYTLFCGVTSRVNYIEV